MNGRRWLWWSGLCVGAVAVLTTVVLHEVPSLVGLASGSVTHAGNRSDLCLPGLAVPVMDSPHISSKQAALVRYNSNPPTSGPHFALTVAPGIYDTPVPDGLLVHALEHGNIGILNSTDTSRPDVGRLRSLAKRYAAHVVLSPYPV
jgi:hypothetical protein